MVLIIFWHYRVTNCISLLRSDYQDGERGGEGKERRPEEQPERDTPTDSLCEQISSARNQVLRESLFVRTSVGTISGQGTSVLCFTTPHPREIKGIKSSKLLIAACPAEGVSVAIQSQVNAHSCAPEVFIAA